MKTWKLRELYEGIELFRKIYWQKIKIKDRILHRIFGGTIEKFGIACFVYAYNLGLNDVIKKPNQRHGKKGMKGDRE